MTNTLASDYADSLIEGIYENLKNETPFGIDQEAFDNGETSSPELTAFDYLRDVLDIMYIVNSNKEYQGALIQLAWGGPNVWLDTMDRTLIVSWGSDRVRRPVPLAFCDYLDETLAELFDTL